MGIVLEGAKLVTASWLYRNWTFSNYLLKIPLILFTVALMSATSIGVFGFLSKAHLQQGAGTIDNSAKVERLDQQIAREKSVIADNEKVIAQLDATINSYLGKDRADRSVTIRKSQAPQRKQLRDDIDDAQKKIDALSEEKFKLQSEVRKLQLDVGPIRYIAELFYGAEGNTERNVEAAVRIFTLLIVSILDPLAVVLLIAANHTILRFQNEKNKKTKTPNMDKSSDDRAIENNEYVERRIEIPKEERNSKTSRQNDVTANEISKEIAIPATISQEIVEDIDEITESSFEKIDSEPASYRDEIGKHNGTESTNLINKSLSFKEGADSTSSSSTESQIREVSLNSLPTIRTPITRIDAHFIPLKINEEEKIETVASGTATSATSEIAPTKNDISQEMDTQEVQENGLEINEARQRGQSSEDRRDAQKSRVQSPIERKSHKYPRALSWLKEFTRTENE